MCTAAQNLAEEEAHQPILNLSLACMRRTMTQYRPWVSHQVPNPHIMMPARVDPATTAALMASVSPSRCVLVNAVRPACASWITA